MPRSGLASSTLCSVVLAVIAACAPGQVLADRQIPLAYTPWTKACRKSPDTGQRTDCFTVSSALLRSREFGRMIASVAVLQPKDGGRPVLRVLLPLGVQLIHGTRIIIDSRAPIQQPYVTCDGISCFSDYVIDDDVSDGLKAGKHLVIQAIDSREAPLTIPIPLAEFAGADSGTPRDWVGLDRKERDILEKMLSTSAAAEQADLSPELTHLSWTKFCQQGRQAGATKVCFTGIDGKNSSGTPMVAAMVIEPENDPKKVLRITVPLNAQLSSGVVLSIDGQSYPNAPYVVCTSGGCMANFTATEEMIEKLKRGSKLSVQAVNRAGRSFTRSLPLDSFRAANSGPPTDPKVLDGLQKAIQ